MDSKKNIQFANSTLKYESDSLIKGSNGLYCFQFSTGTNRDLRQELINYSAKKHGLDEMVKDAKPNKNISEVFWGIFKKPEDQSYEDFVADVKSSKVGFIGNSPIIPTGRDYTRVDCNGNLLVATVNSNLDNYYDGCGNMLIDGKTGEVIRSPKPSVIIRPANEKNGFYPMEIYKTQENKETGNQEVVGMEENYLSPDGKILCSEHNFSYDGQTVLYEVPRNFYVRDGKNVYTDWKVHPTAYVLCEWNKKELFLSALDVVIENRYRIEDGELPIVSDETPYLLSYFRRKIEIDEQIERLGKAYDMGKISESVYDKVMAEINEEYAMIDAFENELKTEADTVLENKFLNDLEMNK